MTEEQFWRGDPYLVVPYREKNRLETELKNNQQWWQGAYNKEAFLSALSSALYWIKKPQKYPSKPYRVTDYTEEEKKELALIERQKAIAQLNAWKDAWNKQNGK